jgi:RNA polymerase sigma-70 factor (ECF subfamily)
MKEVDLVNSLMNGSEKALRMIYDSYAYKLFSFSLRYTKSVEKSEEIVEDVFVWLWKNKEKIKQGYSLEALLVTRTKHFLINSYRANLNSPVFMEYTEYMRDKTGGGYETETWVNYDDFLRRLNSCLQRLPETQSKVIEMIKLKQMKEKEVADQLNLSIQTIRNQLSIGLKSLKVLMAAPE